MTGLRVSHAGSSPVGRPGEPGTHTVAPNAGSPMDIEGMVRDRLERDVDVLVDARAVPVDRVPGDRCRERRVQ